MIPRTFPSTFALNGQQQMVVHFLTSVEGLEKWADYIPVKLEQGGPENSYSGCIDVVAISELTADTQAWKEYIPVHVDDEATDTWTVNNVGYIPYNFALFAEAAMQLDLTNGADLDYRVTFNRTTNATVTGPDGLIAYAEHNLLTFSEQFDNAFWVKANATVTANAVVAPDGTLTADTLTATSAVSIALSSSLAFNETTHTFSCFVRSGTSDLVTLVFETGSTSNRAVVTAKFSTAAITVTSSLGTITHVSSSFVPVGNDWFRLTLTANLSVAANGSARIYIGNFNSAVVGETISIWGAQLEQSSTAREYYPTTVKNLLGFTEHFDNAAWTKSNSFVQTNFVLNSAFAGAVAGTPGTAPTSWPFVLSAGTTAVDDSSITLSVASAARHFIFQGFVLAANTSHTFSLNISAYSGDSAEAIVLLNVSAGSITGSTTILASAGLGRKLITFTTGGSGATVQARIGPGSSSSTAGATSVTFDSVQLVQGETPGDYQRTTSAVAAVGYPDIYGQPFAQKLVENTTNNIHQLSQNPIHVVDTAYTHSIFAKAGERNKIVLRQQNSASRTAIFDLSNGTVFDPGVGITSSITDFGNGWYRCSITANSLVGSINFYRVLLADDTGNTTYTGDGTSGIFIFGAQLSDSASVDPYVYQPVAAPASTAYYGPRFDYDPVTLAPKGLLIEEQRTNLLLRSEEFDNARWSKFRISTEANTVIAPDGTLSGDKLVEDTTTEVHFVAQQPFTLTQNERFAISVFAKYAGRDIGLGHSGVVIGLFNLTTGVATLGPGNVNNTVLSVNMTFVGNGWYRCTAVFLRVGATFPGSVEISLNGRTNYTGDGFSGIFIWGAQLEVGAFPTSYLATSASQVTRAADNASMIGNNFARWFRQDEGTLFSEFRPATSSYGANRNIFVVSDGTVLNFLGFRYTGAGGQISMNSVVAGSSQASLSTGTFDGGTSFKLTGAYKVNDFATSRDEGPVLTNTSGNVPVVDRAEIGSLAGGGIGTQHISRISYFNRRLSNIELRGLTS